MNKTVKKALAAALAAAALLSLFSCGRDKNGGDAADGTRDDGNGGIERPVIDGDPADGANVTPRLKLSSDVYDASSREFIVIGFEGKGYECTLTASGGRFSGESVSATLSDGRSCSFFPDGGEATHERSLSYITASFIGGGRRNNAGIAFIAVENDGWGVSSARISYQCVFDEDADVSDYYVERRFIELETEARRAFAEGGGEDETPLSPVILPELAYLCVRSIWQEPRKTGSDATGGMILRFEGGNGARCRFSGAELCDPMSPGYEGMSELEPGDETLMLTRTANRDRPVFATFYGDGGRIIGFAVFDGESISQTVFPLADGKAQAIDEEYVARRAKEIVSGTSDPDPQFVEMPVRDVFSLRTLGEGEDGVVFGVMGGGSSSVPREGDHGFMSAYSDDMALSSGVDSFFTYETTPGLTPHATCRAYCDAGSFSAGNETDELSWLAPDGDGETDGARIAVVFELYGIPVCVAVEKVAKADGIWRADDSFTVVFPRIDGRLQHVTDEAVSGILEASWAG